jgi:hypothetical protein
LCCIIEVIEIVGIPWQIDNKGKNQSTNHSDPPSSCFFFSMVCTVAIVCMRGRWRMLSMRHW